MQGFEWGQVLEKTQWIEGLSNSKLHLYLPLFNRSKSSNPSQESLEEKSSHKLPME